MSTGASTTTRTAAGPAQAPALVRPAWQRLRGWLALAVVLILGAIVVGTLTQSPGRPLDPTSGRPDGSLALARVLAGYGTTVRASSDLGEALGGGTVVVTTPDDFSDRQLRRLADAPGRLVLVSPGIRATSAVAPGVSPDVGGAVDEQPGCAQPGARAAGSVRLPIDTLAYRVGATGASRCYGGAVVVTGGDASGGEVSAGAISGGIVLLGSSRLLENRALGHRGVAALDVNLISADRTVRRVTWLRAGADARGSGSASFWDLFPDGVYRAFGWLIVLGPLVVLWRARRLGPVVREPLPVVVRSSEVVEGHGRLYARAGARDRAAHALRVAAGTRLGARLALPRRAGANQVAVAIAPVIGRPPAELVGMLAGASPLDDAALVRLATDLDRLETAVGGELNRERR